MLVAGGSKLHRLAVPKFGLLGNAFGTGPEQRSLLLGASRGQT